MSNTYLLTICDKQIIVAKEEIPFYKLVQCLAMVYPEYEDEIAYFLSHCTDLIQENDHVRDIRRVLEDNFGMYLLQFEEEKFKKTVTLEIRGPEEYTKVGMNYMSETVPAYYKIEDPKFSIFYFQKVANILANRGCNNWYQVVELQPGVELSVYREG